MISAAFSLNQGENKLTISRPEGERTYYVYLPAFYSAKANLPLVFGWHGLGDHAENFSTATKLKAYAETYNYIYVYPEGKTAESVEIISSSGFNAGACCFMGKARKTINDFDFLKAIFADLAAKNVVYDSERTFSTGFSNGAMMSSTLPCVFPGTFKAVASVSGVVEINNTAADSMAYCDNVYSNS